MDFDFCCCFHQSHFDEFLYQFMNRLWNDSQVMETVSCVPCCCYVDTIHSMMLLLLCLTVLAKHILLLRCLLRYNFIPIFSTLQRGWTSISMLVTAWGREMWYVAEVVDLFCSTTRVRIIRQDEMKTRGVLCFLARYCNGSTNHHNNFWCGINIPF